MAAIASRWAEQGSSSDFKLRGQHHARGRPCELLARMPIILIAIFFVAMKLIFCSDITILSILPRGISTLLRPRRQADQTVSSQWSAAAAAISTLLRPRRPPQHAV